MSDVSDDLTSRSWRSCQPEAWPTQGWYVILHSQLAVKERSRDCKPLSRRYCIGWGCRSLNFFLPSNSKHLFADDTVYWTFRSRSHMSFIGGKVVFYCAYSWRHDVEQASPDNVVCVYTSGTPLAPYLWNGPRGVRPTIMFDAPLGPWTVVYASLDHIHVVHSVSKTVVKTGRRHQFLYSCSLSFAAIS